ncbi:peptidoglycan D,D-transpeptidase FtsI family protein [Aestuariimicrobium sp. T2.26MG-19.2B]|uniref:peptidoglycan D,D-transpeptidase FtsI family protein n=1 Tax=Aestuariimicrobium sp. T2.26MG-19.2B TaxID=3040679 RepID=UPI00247762A0|nr:penicillin-binding protein 2 [Aestuariimicrobium sp. T2.26MG-19.2B]CAI9404664.1 Penicillin-binding protein A [Aestuariimicrobium sp. T2.26MG-19.2B]
MNGPIRKVAVLAAVMIFALLANLTYAAVVRYPDLNGDVRNRRVRDAEFARDRGAILIGNTPLAQSKATNGRFRYQRSYTQPELYASVTGWYSYDFGSSGLELNYTRQLAGTDDSQAIDRLIATLSGRQPKGASITSTIDPRAQQAAFDGLAGRKGAVVALDYETGAVLANVSLPSYDPNLLATNDLSRAKTNWDSLVKDPDGPLKNRASKEIYPPGSVFKLVTASAAIERLNLTPSSKIASRRALALPQSTTVLTNEIDCGNTTVSLEQALMHSCNTAFAQLGLDTGDQALRDQAEKFGFNTEVTTDVPWATSRFPDKTDRAQLALSAIGQYDVAASPLQVAMVASAIANDGKLMEPYLVSDVRAPNLQLVSSHHPTAIGQVMKPETAQMMQQMMVRVVEGGTGTRAQVSGLVIGGKTGTAQSDPARPPYAWFVAFSEDPKVAVAVFIEEAGIERSDIAGGRLAGPIAAQVIQALR